MPRNIYATRNALKDRLGISATTWDSQLLDMLEEASRLVDGVCDRHFYIETATLYFDGLAWAELHVPDLLTLTTLKTDDDGDLVYDEVWTADDYLLLPFNSWPKTGIIAAPEGDYAWPDAACAKAIQIAGTWGFGDGLSASPVEASGVTATVADGSSLTVTVSAEGTIKAGHTILVESEQMAVQAATADGSKALTVIRGVNGTTAALHTAKAISIYLVPPAVRQCTLNEAAAMFHERASGGLASERLGDYSYTRAEAGQQRERMLRALGPYLNWRAPAGIRR